MLCLVLEPDCVSLPIWSLHTADCLGLLFTGVFQGQSRAPGPGSAQVSQKMEGGHHQMTPFYVYFFQLLVISHADFFSLATPTFYPLLLEFLIHHFTFGKRKRLNREVFKVFYSRPLTLFRSTVTPSSFRN